MTPEQVIETLTKTAQKNDILLETFRDVLPMTMDENLLKHYTELYKSNVETWKYINSFLLGYK